VRSTIVCRQFMVRPIALVGLTALLYGSGCSSTADRITSRRFRDKPFQTLFSNEEPMKVLTRADAEGDDRVDAMVRLKEPSLHGGTQEEQDTAIRILSQTAISDPQGLCRLAAVEALGRFQDPRVPGILLQSYQSTPMMSFGANASGVMTASFNPAEPSIRAAAHFSLDTTARIQGQVMESLGLGRSPEGLQLLMNVSERPAKRPQVKNELETSTGTFDAENYRFDVRLAAIHAIRHYEGDALAKAALLRILKAERDTAIQNRCMESLRKVTGKDLGNTPQAWLETGTPG
jgi:hypothetical protein